MGKTILWVLGALAATAGGLPAGAQTVYKCGYRTYSQAPCAPKRIVNTDEASVPAKANPKEVDVRRIEENRVLARSLRRMPDETVAQFTTRRHRATLLETDRDECARLDTRIPFERERMKSPDPDEVDKAQVGYSDSKKRFKALHC